MTQAPPGPSFDPPTSGGGFVEPIVRPRWSAAAITGFIMSFLLVLAPLGIILGIVGIFRTRGGRRRGMGISIAAIPIGLVVSVVTGFVIAVGLLMAAVLATGLDSTGMLRVSQLNVAAEASDLYEVMSARFRVVVSEEAFQTWATDVAAKHGTLQSARQADTNWLTPEENQTFVLNLTGDFVNGPANISVTIGLDGWTPEIDDIAVDGVSPLPDD